MAVIIEVDPAHAPPQINITLANGWAARIKEPNDCLQSEMLTTVVGPTGNISSGGNTVIIEVLPDKLEVAIRLPAQWEVNLHR